jgi:hypothetical protein
MYRYLRIPLFVASLLALAFSSYTLYRDLEDDPVTDFRHPFGREVTPEQKAEWAEKAKKRAYASALAEDGFVQLDPHDFDNAQRRFDQAAAADPDVENWDGVRDAGRVLARELGLSETAQVSPTNSPHSAHADPRSEHT